MLLLYIFQYNLETIGHNIGHNSRKFSENPIIINNLKGLLRNSRINLLHPNTNGNIREYKYNKKAI